MKKRAVLFRIVAHSGDRAREDGLLRLADVAKVLCAWLAAERTALGIAPCRRLTGPSVAPRQVDDGCGSCSGLCHGSRLLE